MAVMSLEQMTAVGWPVSDCSLPKPMTPPLRVWSHSITHFFSTGSLSARMEFSKSF